MGAHLPATAEDTIGPYYPPSFVMADRRHPAVNEGLVVKARGQAVILDGQVLDVAGERVAPVLLEFWQADADGSLRTPATLDHPELDSWFEGYARQYCSTGRFRLHTIMPGVIGAAVAGDAPRAPHVTLNIFCDGINRVVTQLFFEGQAANAADPLLESLPQDLQARLIARLTGEEDGTPVYAIDIIMRGPGETPFFDDLEG